MNVDIIAVVSGWVKSETIQGNFEILGRLLGMIGMEPANVQVVDNNIDSISDAFLKAADRSSIVITLSDLDDNDFTMSTVCKKAGIALLRQENEDEGWPWLLPENSAVFKAEGAFACVFEHKGALVMMLPARRREMLALFCGEIMDHLANLSDKKVLKRTVGLYGVKGSVVKEKLKDMMTGGNVCLVVIEKGVDTDVMVFAASPFEETARANLDILTSEIERRFEKNCYGVDVGSLEAKVVELLRRHRLKIATAESCTAGLVSKRLTDVPGASEVFEFGVAAYSGEIKKKVLKINEETLRRHGEVSAETACAMAEHVRVIGKADLGIGITGIAGPGGGTREKPVGLVYVALSDGRHIWVTKLLNKGSREECRNLSASHALDLVRRYIEALPGVLEGGNRISRAGSISGARGKRAALLVNEAERKEPTKEFFPGDDLEENEAFGAEAFALEERETGVAETFAVEENEPAGAEALSLEDEEPVGDETFALGEKEGKKSGFSAFKDKVLGILFTYAIPRKGDRALEIARKLVFVLALLVFVGAGGMLIKEGLVDPTKNKQLIDKIKDMIENPAPVENPIPGVREEMQLPAKTNPDFYGWLAIPGLNLELPVMRDHPNEPEYYLYRNFEKKYSKYGTPFLDHRLKLDGKDRNVIIYGHHMKNKQMFGKLVHYRNLKTYVKNPVITFDTIYENTKWKIFAAILTNVKEKEGPVFYYWRTEFRNDSEFMQFVDDLKIRSFINAPVDVRPDDTLLLLSTCAYDVPDARFVVVARKVRPGESEKVDTSKATLNPDPLYPVAWYTKNKKQMSKRLTDYLDEFVKRNETSPPPIPGGTKPNPDLKPTESEAPSSSSPASSLPPSSSSPPTSEDSSGGSETSGSVSSSDGASSGSSSTGGGNEGGSESSGGGQAGGGSEMELPVGPLSIVWYKDQNNGNVGSLTAFELMVRIVSMEMDQSYEMEALKAQAVASYTFFLYSTNEGRGNSKDNPFNCSLRWGDLETMQKARQAVEQVFGEVITYSGFIVYTPYFDCSAGITNSCASVYGNALPHLQSVISPDQNARYYQSSVTYSLEDTIDWIVGTPILGLTREDVESFIAQNGADKLFVITERDPVSNYVTRVTIAGKTALTNGNPITGRTVREQIYTVTRTETNMQFRSHHFSVRFNEETQNFEFDVKGYGHGVGMSQEGANQMAKDGKNYIQILSHYYSGVEITTRYAGY